MKEPNCHQELREAMKQRKDEKERIKRIKALFVQECNLRVDDARRDKYLEKFTIVEVTRDQTPYPPSSNCVYESEQIHDIWHNHFRLGKPKDKRLKELPMLLLESQYLQLDVAEDQNYIFVDSNTKEILGLVARNWMAGGKKETLDWVNEIIIKECQVRKSVRILANFVKWDIQLVPESKPVLIGATSQILGNYTVRVGADNIEFDCVPMAPPCGFMAYNYARGTHNEKCPHKYALFWTTARTYGSEEGSHFFIADYGIRIKQSAYSVVIWKPTDFHGTTLSVKGPTDESVSHQIGMSIVTPVRLVKLWEKYQQEQITADNVEAILVESDDSEEE
ncbi:hypothetical protein P167DRAFT_580264 [Morchella conica CCBAS932]|uniref:Uncharacterized protein n=1 Tax=Morchella conica CCBAS932 TaxID=1392247 RepID=A0A3N4K7X1_9PEZI|nr:hypothetical protein P167DRAFT_580264 [Morchella conica CCBAS932]